MIKIEANSLKEAYGQAARDLDCSAKELKVEVIQKSSPGIFGLFKKKAIIVATKDSSKKRKTTEEDERVVEKKSSKESKVRKKTIREEKKPQEKKTKAKKKTNKKQEKLELGDKPESKAKPKQKTKQNKQEILNDTIMPTSFVSDQDDEYDNELSSGVGFTADYDDEYDNDAQVNMKDIVTEIKEEINTLFDLACFDMKEVSVSQYDDNTISIELKGDDSALLIGKEGYRYKALSYMLYNWINTKYGVQLRLEIAEFLKNQEESIDRYLLSVYENIEKDGHTQTRILDGVLIQIALRKLREVYSDKYVVIRSTKDGQKYIIVNDYHSN